MSRSLKFSFKAELQQLTSLARFVLFVPKAETANFLKSSADSRYTPRKIIKIDHNVRQILLGLCSLE